MGRSGGWPLTIVATPDRRPFYCATYLPKTSRQGRLGLLELVQRVNELWQRDPDELIRFGDELIGALDRSSQIPNRLSPDSARQTGAFEALQSRFDEQWGGFGDAPKFPSAHQLRFLLRYGHRTGEKRATEMVEHTLISMRRGGIFDQIGGGFHRYATDRHWRHPHFEKMLSDQALLAVAYSEAFLVSGRNVFAKTVGEIISYVLRDLRSSHGPFYASEDADTGGKEGAFYLWSWSELVRLLTEEQLKYARDEWHVRPDGNVYDESTGEPTGLNAFYGGNSDGDGDGDALIQWNEIVSVLLSERTTRRRPMRDEKVLTDWNGLMIAALSYAGRSFREPSWISSAEKAAAGLLMTHVEQDGSLYHSAFEGSVSAPGFLDDYAFFVWGLVELFQSTGNAGWLRHAISITRRQNERFWDGKNGGFFLAETGDQDVPIRQKLFHDGAIPAGASVAAMNMLRLATITGDDEFEQKAHIQLEISLSESSQVALGFASTMSACEVALSHREEFVVVQKGSSELLGSLIDQTYLPNAQIVKITASNREELIRLLPHLEGYTSNDRSEIVYICRNRVCEAPIVDYDSLRSVLKK